MVCLFLLDNRSWPALTENALVNLAPFQIKTFSKMSRFDIAEEDERKSLQDWWTLHSELAEHGVDLSRDYIVKTVNGKNEY